MIGETVRDKLFPAADPIGQQVRLKKVSCEIVGLLAPKGQTSIGADEDDLVVMPLRAFQRRITRQHQYRHDPAFPRATT